MAVGQIAASLLAEVVVHNPISIIIVFPRVCRVVTMFVDLRPMIGSDVGEKDCGADEGWSVFALRSSVMVDLEGLNSHRHRSQEVLPSRRLGVQCLHPFSVVFKFMGIAPHSAADVEWLWKSTLCGEGGRQMFVLFGMGY